ncbi:MAG: hypothetical protein D6679_08120 [Candidatus Hydrogenedentota bacterium]|nr:MAG: hypothetical protein D6679_08120 [Candidatus Hydrogenedentota bacterium]
MALVGDSSSAFGLLGMTASLVIPKIAVRRLRNPLDAVPRGKGKGKGKGKKKGMGKGNEKGSGKRVLVARASWRAKTDS